MPKLAYALSVLAFVIGPAALGKPPFDKEAKKKLWDFKNKQRTEERAFDDERRKAFFDLEMKSDEAMANAANPHELHQTLEKQKYQLQIEWDKKRTAFDEKRFTEWRNFTQEQEKARKASGQ
jgi:hypothetical protein